MIGKVYDAAIALHMSAFAQEIAVILVFFMSYVAWRHLRERSTSSKRVSGLGGRRGAASNASRTSSGAANRGVALGGSAAHRTTQASAEVARLAAAAAASEKDTAQIAQCEQQMLQHLEQLEFTRALNLYRACERNRTDVFSEDLYYAFIQSAVRVGKVDVVERMLQAMRRNGMTPNARFWQRTLKMLSSRKYYSACLTAQAVFEDDVPCDKVSYSCLINAALEIGQPERAAAMLERYEQSGVEAKDYVLFFRTYVANGDIDAAEKVFRRLGAETTPLMLNLLLLACVNAKDPKRALALVNEAHELEAAALARNKAAAESPSGASQALENEVIVDVVSYNTIIKGFAQLSMFNQCFQCLQDMLERNLEPDDITLGLLLDACIGNNKLGLADEVLSLLMSRDKPVGTVMCTLFIKGLVRANRLPRALQLYEEMRSRETGHPDVVTYSVLIKALVDQSDLDHALKLMVDMKEAGLVADDIILTHILDGCRHTGNHEVGKMLFKELLDNGVVPSDFTLVSMLKLHGRCGAHEEAYELVKTWKDRFGVDPSVIHYTCIMSGCLRSKKYEQAWQAYDLMVTRGVSPDATTITTLLPGVAAAQHWPRVVQLARTALTAKPPMKIPAETLNSALAGMLAGGGNGAQYPAHNCAMQLQALMREAHVPITAKGARR
eukprot:TRINITY_DN47264_c0_g1_i1.p1 TRINITY_DN47264_c0_g1~~TRINITY_DN47264_c0_g1_i1.p1  ORF type:complete len:667 (-),score=167.80 TRINITY_DN47264_c0_g1_i1:148-2148(-)